ncbi:MAG: histidine phosphatase family protein [Rhodanobacteraceae bacterium]
MHELILLRHAQARSAAADGMDRNRALSEEGIAQARHAGRWLVQHHHRPGLILCSPALRARQTADAVHESMPESDLRKLESIYDASPGELLAMLDEQPPTESVMLVGHNPGMERLLGLLTNGRSGSHRGMPPASLACISFDQRIEPGAGILQAFWTP